MMKKLIIVLVHFFIGLNVFAQDSMYINYLVKRISEQQIKKDKFFMPGIFPSYISGREKFNTKKVDNTIFYNLLIYYNINEYYPLLNDENKKLADDINNNTKKLLPKFKNKNGRNTYNYWRTDSTFRFPYTWWIPIVRGHVSLPDDMDDTVLGQLANDATDSVASQIHALMQQYINTNGNLKTTYSTYKKYKTYSTWFGKKVPVVFDVCVLCNVLTFIEKEHLPFSATDIAAVDLMVKTIETNDYIKHPHFVSPYYGKTSLILYHLSRLMSAGKINELEKFKSQLIDEATSQLNNSDNVLEKIILSSALIKWGEKPAVLILPPVAQIKNEIEKNNFPFFIGNIPSYLKQPFKENMINRNMLLFYHYCPAWNDALLLEYILLSQKK